MTNKVWYFLGVTFSVTWVIEAVALWWLGDLSALNNLGGEETVILVLIGCMYVPALAVVIVQKGFYGEPLGALGISFGINRWWGIAVVVPLIVAVASVAVSALWPDVRLSSGEAFLIEQIESSPLAGIDTGDEQVPPPLTGPLLALALVGVALVAGPTVNALAAFGEEFGWRGFLQKELAPLGFWRSSIVIGGLWGLWHLPLILGGYNYPGTPRFGLVMMILFTIGWSPVLAYLVVHGRSVFPAALAHGTVNSVGGATYVFLEGGSRLEIGLLGIAGVVVLGFANLAVWAHQQWRPTPFQDAWEAFQSNPADSG